MVAPCPGAQRTGKFNQPDCFVYCIRTRILNGVVEKSKTKILIRAEAGRAPKSRQGQFGRAEALRLAEAIWVGRWPRHCL